MKVCHFTSAHKPNDIRIFHKECVSLAKIGHDVYLVSAHESKLEEGGVTFIHAKNTANSRISRMLRTTRSVYQEALKLDADIYHFHDPELLFYGFKLKRKGKIVIYDAHEDVPRQIMAKFWIPRLLRKCVSLIFERFENYIAKRLSAVVVSTPHIRKRFIQIHPKTIDVCNYPLLQELVGEIDDNSKQEEICYVGGLSVVRGIHEMMESLSNLPNIRLNLAGSFSTNELEKEVKSHKNWSQVSFHGYVGRQELISLFQRSKVGLVTLLPTPNHLESLPIKMFEYMSAGIPVVCSNFPLWMEIVQDNECGISVDPSNSEEIAEAVQQLLKSPERSKLMGENGKKAVIERYNWEQQFKKLAQLYEELKH